MIKEADTLDAIFHVSAVAQAEFDIRGNRLVRVNRAMCDLTGYSEPELLGMSFAELTHPEDRERDLALFRDYLAGDSAEYRVLKRYIRKDGALRWVDVSGAVSARGGAGEPLRTVGVIVDVTERERAVEALRINEERMRLASRVASIGHYEFRIDTRELLLSEQLRALLGLTGEEPVPPLDGPVPAWVHPADRDGLRAAIEESRSPGGAGVFEHEHRIVRADGEVRWVTVRSRTFFDPTSGTRVPLRALGVVVDTTERKEAELALRRREAHLQLFIESIPAAVAVLDRGLRYLAASDRWLLEFAAGRREVLGQTLEEAADELPSSWREACMQALAGAVVGSEEERHLGRDGVEQWLRWEARPWHDLDGTIGGVSLFAEEISATKALAEQLRRRVEEVETLMQVAPVGLWVAADPACTDIVGNPMANALFEAVEGENVSASAPAAGPARRFFRDGRELASAELPMQRAAAANAEVRGCEFEVLLPSGARISLFGSASPLRNREGEARGCIGAFVDITERKRAEQALLQKSEELSRINIELEEFAYVVSHDLRAPLRAVSNLATVIEEDAGAALDAENRARLRAMRERVVIMDQLVSGLLRYAGLGRERPQSAAVPLAPLVDELLATLPIKPGFIIEHERPAPALPADPVQLKLVLQNLILNAMSHHDRGAGRIAIRNRDGGAVWILEVADDGPGIPEEARERAFRMFSGSGKPGHTGIGLALVRKIVLSHGGRIEIAANQPRGAVFRIEWPKRPDRDGRAADEQTARERPFRRS